MKLSEARKKMGITQKELGEKLGVAQNTISAWENGTREPDMESLIKLCTVLKTSLDTLLGVPSFAENKDSELVRDAMQSSHMLSGLLAVFQSSPPEEVQKFFDVAKIMLPKMKDILEENEPNLFSDFDKSIQRLKTSEEDVSCLPAPRDEGTE